MSYFAAALAISENEWQGAELDLDDIESVDDLADEVLEIESDAGSIVVLVEADEWFGVIRVDEDDDPQVFISDASEAGNSALGQVFLNYLGAVDVRGDDEELTEEGTAHAGPIGEAGLLSGLGIAAADLEMIATKGGLTSTDALGEVAIRMGVGDVLEDLR